MSGTEAGKSYLEADVRTASPLRLVVLVCNLGIDRLKRSVALLGEDPSKRDEFLEHTGKARDAVTELMGAVMPERSSEVANNLLALYSYFFRTITEARIGMDAAPLEEVIRFWESLRDGWNELLKQGVTGPDKTETQEAGQMISMTG